MTLRTIGRQSVSTGIRGVVLAIIALVGLLAVAPSALARKPIISYIDEQEHLQLYDAELGSNVSPPPPVPVPKGKAAQFRWGMSLDARYIVYTDAKKKLHLLDRATEEEVPLPGIDKVENPGDLTVSDTGLIGFDKNNEKPIFLYDSATGQFVDAGLGDADPSEPTNQMRQVRLSGDGKFFVTTCFDEPMKLCETEADADSDVYLQDLMAKQRVPFPDEPAGESVDEEHPCINGDGSLIAVERKPEKESKQKDIYLFQRSGSAFTKVETPGLNDAELANRYCELTPGGGYVSQIQEEEGGGEAEFKLYERATQSFVKLPKLPFDFRSTLSIPSEPQPKPIRAPRELRCGGKRVTIKGTGKRNRIRGTKRRDVIAGLGGNDVIRGLGGNDIICGGAGKDRLIGGKGRDLLLGGKGRDVLLGGPGKDELRGGPGEDRQKQ